MHVVIAVVDPGNPLMSHTQTSDTSIFIILGFPVSKVLGSPLVPCKVICFDAVPPYTDMPDKRP